MRRGDTDRSIYSFPEPVEGSGADFVGCCVIMNASVDMLDLDRLKLWRNALYLWTGG